MTYDSWPVRILGEVMEDEVCERKVGVFHVSVRGIQHVISADGSSELGNSRFLH